MAAQKKKATSKKGGRSVKKIPKKKKNPLTIEVTAIVAIAAGVFLIISIFSRDTTGFIGGLTEKFFKGMFGFGAYLLPFIIVGVSLFFLFAREKYIPNTKTIAGMVLFVCIISMTHTATMNSDVSYKSLTDYLAAYFDGGGINNGGLIGAVFGNFFFGVAGKAGAYIILGAISLAAAVMLTGKSFFESLRYIAAWCQEFFKPGEYEEYDEYEDDYDDYIEEELPTPKPKPRMRIQDERSRRSPEPVRTVDRASPRRGSKDGGTFVIEDRSGQEDKPKILLFSEEMNARKRPNPILAPRKSTRDDVLAHPIVSDVCEIKVKGLVEEFPEEEELLKDLLKEEIYIENPGLVQAGRITSAEPYEDDLDLAEEIEGWESVEYAATVDEEDPECAEDFEDDDIDIFAEVQVSEPQWTEAIKQEPARPELKPQLAVKPEAKVKAPQIDVNPVHFEYVYPSMEMLNKNPNANTMGSRAQILENSRKLEDTLKSFGVEAKVVEVSKGPTVTRYELSPGPGVKVSKISSLADDLALNLAAVGIRIEAPIPGKAAVGIEIPNKEVQPVYLREVLDDEAFTNFPSKLAFALGKDIAGNTVVWDIGRMPHLLIAGATGAGKSVCINTLITSIIYKANPNEVKLLMVDPKVVELSVYNGIPHLLIPVVTDPKKAAGALNWAVAEMISRYNLFAETSVRDLKGYNALKAERGETDLLPQIVIIIDELADLMMAAPGEVEDAICRLAQMARAAGLHLIIATQRPSVDVITGLIKANVPSRLAFAVSSGTDSRTILDMTGAEKLLGKGDMLFCPVGMGKPLRIQGAFISDKEVEGLVSFLKAQQPHEYDQDMIDKITSSNKMSAVDGEVDEFFEDAVTFVIQREKASASMLQRQFRIGYNRASRLIEDLETRGIIGPEDGSKPRKVLLTMYQWNEMRSE